MELVFIRNLRSGMVVAQDIFPEANNITPFVRKNTTLTPLLIQQLEEHGVRFAYIDNRGHKPISQVYTAAAPPPQQLYVPKPEPTISPKLQSDALAGLETIFSQASFAADGLHDSSQIIKQLDSVVGQLVDSIIHNKNALVNIFDLKSYDEYTYHHSLSVAVLSIAIAQHMQLNTTDLNRIGMCAIMHDIGKTAIPIEIIHKTSRLSDNEFSVIKGHSPAGFDYLHKNFFHDEDICKGVLHHHEKLDGTGYPNGIKDDDIPLWSKIISVADVYDALTSNRPYRVPMQPAEAIEYIMGGVGSSFDYEVVTAFLKKVEFYPLGSYIELSNGEIGVVLRNDNQMRPVIRVLSSGDIWDLYRDRFCLNVVVTRTLPNYTAARPL